MSKKIILLSAFSASLFFSCQKENIQPNRNHSCGMEESSTVRSSVTSDKTDKEDITSNQLYLDITRDEIKITDPNNDEDRNKKRKGNN